MKLLVCYYQTALSTGVSQGYYSLYTGQLPVNCKLHMRPLFKMEQGISRDISSWHKVFYLNHGCFSHLVNCCSGLNCFHCSRSTALGCLSMLFLSSPVVIKLAHICARVIWVGPLSTQLPFGALTGLSPLACCCPSESPKLAIPEVIL